MSFQDAIGLFSLPIQQALWNALKEAVALVLDDSVNYFL
jgi:hypothetical protein